MIWKNKTSRIPNLIITRHNVIEAHQAAGKKQEKKWKSLDTKVLVVDDALMNQKVITLMLKYFECQTDVASNGKEALEKAGKKSYDIIFMDCQMPEMDGIETTTLIRKSEAQSGKHTPIIAMTAFVLKGDREKCFAAGMDDYITKPLSERNVRRILEKWLKNEKFSFSEQTSDERCEEQNLENDFESVDFKQLTMLLKIPGSGPEFVAKMINIFLKDIPPSFEDLRQSITKGEEATLANVSHNLKSTCANVGAFRMQSFLEILENLGRLQAIQGAFDIMGNLEREFERVRIVLESHKESLGEK